jgi:c-di-GMP-binding flagellar brake protein YcgR
MRSGTYRVSGAKPVYAGVQRHRRILFSIPLTLRHLIHGGVRASRGISLDISQSGIGALVEGGLQVGDTVEIDVQLPDRQLQAVAIVRHTSSIRSGFEFFGLTPAERAHLAAIVGSA